MKTERDLITFSELYRKYSPEVYRYAVSLCGGRAEAEDLVSETFLRVWNSAVPVRIQTVRSYLIAITRNLFLEELRKRRHERPIEFDIADQRNFAAEQEARQDWARLRPLLEELPEITRSALIMQSVLEMPYAEIEAILGVPATALKVRICRA